ncbi:MAG: histidine kinase [Defluviitaleaceae bacterium]|nr:histidine kinase [Defluviitaleaceae bacterium]
MEKNKSLVRRCFIFFIIFCCINTAGYISLFLYNKYAAVAVIIIANLSLSFLAYKFLVKPYLYLKNIFSLFLEEQIYQELFEQEYNISSELSDVLKKLDTMLDKQKAIEMSKRQAEYLALQNQINPHFLYNTLEAIRGDALSEGMVKIAGTTEALATFFRYAISEVENLVTLEDELNYVENYFIIQQYRFGDKLKMKINIQGNAETIYKIQVPKLTLQPIIENAIYHGLEMKKDGGTVSINIETTKKLLLLSITDDGMGMPEELLERVNQNLNKVVLGYINYDKKNSSIALRNVSSRIKLLFGEEYGLHLFSTLGYGTDVRITLPLGTVQK